MTSEQFYFVKTIVNRKLVKSGTLSEDKNNIQSKSKMKITIQCKMDIATSGGSKEGGTLGTRAPQGPNSFIIMQFSAKKIG